MWISLLEISAIQVIGPIFSSPLTLTAFSNITYENTIVLPSVLLFYYPSSTFYLVLTLCIFFVLSSTRISFTLHLCQSMCLLPLNSCPNTLNPLIILPNIFSVYPLNLSILSICLSYSIFFGLKMVGGLINVKS